MAALLSLLAGFTSGYVCLNTNLDGPNACAGLPNPSSPADPTKDLVKQLFTTKFCCRVGSGDLPVFKGFACSCPEIPPASCMDDIKGEVRAQANMECSEMVAKGCDKTLHELNSQAPEQLFVHSSVVCPLSCGKCTAGGNQLCKDDFDGVLAKQKTNCAALLKEGDCKKNLHTLEPNVPDMNFLVEDVCPATCKACHGSEVLSAQTDGVLTQASHAHQSAIIGVAAGLAGLAGVALFVNRLRNNQVAREMQTTITPTTLAQL